MFTVTIFFICILISTLCLRVIPFVRYATLLACLKVSLLFWLLCLPFESIMNSLLFHLGTSIGILEGTLVCLFIGILYPAFSLRLAERCTEDFEIETFPMTILTVYTFSALSLSAVYGLGLAPILNC
ncbi:MAG: hypothetical protein VX619_07920 [bacterium]|nr:hypothetical protein [bacterium]